MEENNAIIWAAIIGTGGALIGGLLGSWASVRINKQNLTNNHLQKQLDLLIAQKATINQALDEEHIAPTKSEIVNKLHIESRRAYNVCRHLLTSLDIETLDRFIKEIDTYKDLPRKIIENPDINMENSTALYKTGMDCFNKTLFGSIEEKIKEIESELLS